MPIFYFSKLWNKILSLSFDVIPSFACHMLNATDEMRGSIDVMLGSVATIVVVMIANLF